MNRKNGLSERRQKSYIFTGFGNGVIYVPEYSTKKCIHLTDSETFLVVVSPLSFGVYLESTSSKKN